MNTYAKVFFFACVGLRAAEIVVWQLPTEVVPLCVGAPDNRGFYDSDVILDNGTLYVSPYLLDNIDAETPPQKLLQFLVGKARERDTRAFMASSVRCHRGASVLGLGIVSFAATVLERLIVDGYPIEEVDRVHTITTAAFAGASTLVALVGAGIYAYGRYGVRACERKAASKACRLYTAQHSSSLMTFTKAIVVGAPRTKSCVKYLKIKSKMTAWKRFC